MAKPDPDRAAKWRARAEEWKRLATLAEDDYIARVCERNADHDHSMADFWDAR